MSAQVSKCRVLGSVHMWPQHDGPHLYPRLASVAGWFHLCHKQVTTLHLRPLMRSGCAGTHSHLTATWDGHVLPPVLGLGGRCPGGWVAHLQLLPHLPRRRWETVLGSVSVSCCCMTNSPLRAASAADSGGADPASCALRFLTVCSVGDTGEEPLLSSSGGWQDSCPVAAGLRSPASCCLPLEAAHSSLPRVP